MYKKISKNSEEKLNQSIWNKKLRSSSIHLKYNHELNFSLYGSEFGKQFLTTKKNN